MMIIFLQDTDTTLTTVHSICHMQGNLVAEIAV